MHRRPIHAARHAAILLALAATAACSAQRPPCDGDTPCGVYVTVGTLEGIRPGTHRGDVVTLLGEPVSVDASDDGPGDEIWTWCCELLASPRAEVLLLTQREPDADSTKARIAFHGGRVVRAWVEPPAVVVPPLSID